MGIQQLLTGGNGIIFISASSKNSGTSTVNVPSPTGIVDGDLLVSVSFHPANQTLTLPSGFTSVFNESDATSSLYIATKIASSETGGDYTYTWTGSGGSTTGIVVFRNASAINTVGSTNKPNSIEGNAIPITPSDAGVLCGAFFTESTGATVSTPVPDMTTRINLDASVPMYLCTKNQGSVSTGFKTMFWSASNINLSILFQVSK